MVMVIETTEVIGKYLLGFLCVNLVLIIIWFLLLGSYYLVLIILFLLFALLYFSDYISFTVAFLTEVKVLPPTCET